LGSLRRWRRFRVASRLSNVISISSLRSCAAPSAGASGWPQLNVTRLAHLLATRDAHLSVSGMGTTSLAKAKIMPPGCVVPSRFWEFRLSMAVKSYKVNGEETNSGRRAVGSAAAARNLNLPLPVSPPGENRGGRVPPTPPKPGGSPTRGVSKRSAETPLVHPPFRPAIVHPTACMVIQHHGRS